MSHAIFSPAEEQDSFQLFGQYCHHSYTAPDISAYEREKHLRVTNGNNRAQLLKYAPLPCPPALSGDPVNQRSWRHFWGRRLQAARNSAAKNLPGIFPGNSIRIMAKEDSQWRLRLPLEQLKEDDYPWGWALIDKPALSLVDVKGVQRALARALAAKHQPAPLEHPLSFWREKEIYLTYASAASDWQMIGSGFFGNSWIEVGVIPLTELRETEICQSPRLFAEIINLASRGWAPLVINEHKQVTDGNHRLVAARIWNILRQCQEMDWSLSNGRFQRQVSEIAAREISQDQVSLHQSLRHLEKFLSSDYYRRRLIETIAPSRHPPIQYLPAVILPEDISGAVFKSSFDESGTQIFFPPYIYKTMFCRQGTVLPCRSVYHFTDCAPLPWFAILQ